MALMGLDIGTSGCKAAIIDFDGNIKGQSFQEYSLTTPKPGWEELDPRVVWESVKKVVRESLFQYKRNDVKAISVSSFGEAAVPIDINGNILYNSIIYIDIRGKEEAGYLKTRLGNKKILGITGTYAHPLYTINKIMWMKQHMPDIYRKTWKFLLFSDFILYRLGSKPHTDYSLAARTMAFDIVKKVWSPEILECAGVDENKFGEPVQAGTVVGEISKSIAEELGLPKGVILVAGGHDQPCAALGAGVIHSDLAVDGLGTAECITPAFESVNIAGSMAENCFACVPHVIKNMYVTYAFTFTSGSLLKWYRNNFGAIYAEEAEKRNINLYDLLIEKASPGPAELLLLPHFAGAATPYMDTESKGAIIGLNINSKPSDIIKAILEGITFEIMVNVQKLEESGVKVNELRTVGGLAKSDAFLQLKSDMMGRKVSTLNISEAGTLGVAILAGTASGAYGSIENAVQRLVKIKKEFFPNEKLHEIYMEKFQNYKRVYPAVKSIYEKIK